MKRYSLSLGSLFAAALTHANRGFSDLTQSIQRLNDDVIGRNTPHFQRDSRGKGGKHSTRNKSVFAVHRECWSQGDPKGKRDWNDLSDAHQRARFDAAAEKRQRKAGKLGRGYFSCRFGNLASQGPA